VYLVKKEESKWWSRLVKQEGRTPVFIKVDWNKWVDEDEQDEKGCFTLFLYTIHFSLLFAYNRPKSFNILNENVNADFFLHVC